MSEMYVRPDVRVKLTKTLPNPTEYAAALKGECAAWCFDEEQSPELSGTWRKDIFKVGEDIAVDLEIGTGNGYHFASYAVENKQRCLVGFELKYKPLIQSIRRAIRDGAEQVRICRYDARLICDVFAPGELNDVIVHFPDPYLKKKFHKRRLLSGNFLRGLFELQRPGSKIFFKTDSEEYFDYSMQNLRGSSYEITGETRDLHNSEFAEGNFVTAFEKIFLRKGQPIFYCQLLRS